MIEVEYRFPKNVEKKLRELGFTFKKKVQCRDSYSYLSKSGEQKRLRFMEADGKEVYRETCKSLRAGHFLEDEHDITKHEYRRIMYNRPIVVEVIGRRKVFVKDNVSVCSDKLHFLGNWTEIEVMVDSQKKIQEAEKKIFEIANALGVKKEQLTKKTYPEMIYDKFY
jgi:predicted adenylyl cyclase CyaB